MTHPSLRNRLRALRQGEAQRAAGDESDVADGRPAAPIPEDEAPAITVQHQRDGTIRFDVDGVHRTLGSGLPAQVTLYDGLTSIRLERQRNQTILSWTDTDGASQLHPLKVSAPTAQDIDRFLEKYADPRLQPEAAASFSSSTVALAQWQSLLIAIAFTPVHFTAILLRRCYSPTSVPRVAPMAAVAAIALVGVSLDIGTSLVRLEFLWWEPLILSASVALAALTALIAYHRPLDESTGLRPALLASGIPALLGLALVAVVDLPNLTEVHRLAATLGWAVAGLGGVSAALAASGYFAGAGLVGLFGLAFGILATPAFAPFYSDDPFITAKPLSQNEPRAGLFHETVAGRAIGAKVAADGTFFALERPLRPAELNRHRTRGWTLFDLAGRTATVAGSRLVLRSQGRSLISTFDPNNRTVRWHAHQFGVGRIKPLYTQSFEPTPVSSILPGPGDGVRFVQLSPMPPQRATMFELDADGTTTASSALVLKPTYAVDQVIEVVDDVWWSVGIGPVESIRSSIPLALLPILRTQPAWFRLFRSTHPTSSVPVLRATSLSCSASGPTIYCVNMADGKPPAFAAVDLPDGTHRPVGHLPYEGPFDSWTILGRHAAFAWADGAVEIVRLDEGTLEIIEAPSPDPDVVYDRVFVALGAECVLRAMVLDEETTVQIFYLR